ncbi:MAG: triose-phosphate isomerase [Planctomycetaceae bacterium]
MRRQLVAGNWKMNTTCQSAIDLARAIVAQAPGGAGSAQIVICPPFPYLLHVAEAIRGSHIELGAQNAWHEPPGAYTGEVGLEMLRDVGCRWVILGHSERRQILGETDELISKKVRAAITGGLKVILCVGETLPQRQAGQTEAVLDSQLEGSLQGVDASAMGEVVLAYEPVWAIGTGVVASTEQAESAHAHLRRRLTGRYNPQAGEATRILYGGSVKPGNSQGLLSQPNVDGALVGGASLKAADFLTIVRAAAGSA